LIDALALLRKDASTATLLESLRIIIVPHEPKPPTLERLENMLPLTRWSLSTPETQGHLVMDSVGLLLSLYAIADAAFVGGGFGSGVHSVTEAAAYGLPVACGPFVDRSPDAQALHALGALTTVTHARDFADWLRDVVFLAQEQQRIGKLAAEALASKAGSSDVIARRIAEYATSGERSAQ
jgi:3-deoxy-D-manno-octulosonic-acid transferase